MRTGQRSALIEIQRRSGEKDELGEPIDNWVKVREVWANVLHKSGLEVMRADTPTSIVQASMRIPLLAAEGVDASMRVLCGGVPYEILALMPDLIRREHVDLVCQTGASNG